MAAIAVAQLAQWQLRHKMTGRHLQYMVLALAAAAALALESSGVLVPGNLAWWQAPVFCLAFMGAVVAASLLVATFA